jgi:S-sulfo-L-cysteine synthase (3-phospho-L-serine-dependent)
MVRPSMVFVESNTSGTGALFVERARALGFAPVLMARDPSRFAFAKADALTTLALDTSNIGAMVAVCRSLPSVAGVTTSSDYAAPNAAALARALDCPGPEPQAVQAARDKFHQRSVLRAAGLDCVACRVVRCVHEAADAALAFGLPVVLKPRSASGSLGVRLCQSRVEVIAHAEVLLEATPGAEGFLVEEFIAGQEVSAELFDGRVLGLTAKHLGPLPAFVEIGHDYPAPIQPASAARLTALAEATAAALHLTWGPAHLELRDNGTRSHLIEANPRLGGGFIPELVRLASGVDLIDATLRRAAGLSISLAPRHRLAASIRFIVPAAAGRIESIDFAKARGVPGVEAVASYRQAGTAFEPRGDFTDRIGHVIATALDGAGAASAAEQALELIVVRMGHGQDLAAATP